MSQAREGRERSTGRQAARPDHFTARVPASTSNLGSGFDALGLAVSRYLTVTWTPGDEPLSVHYAGTLTGRGGDPRSDLAARALAAGLAEAGAPPPGGRLQLDSAIPVERGLGSSAAAVAAGLTLAAAFLDQPLDRRVALERAVELEGHPDNAAPALLGGLVAITRDAAGRPLPFSLPLAPELAFAFAAPGSGVSTVSARQALPEAVPHGRAVAALGRAAALVHGLATADAQLLRAGFQDDLHVPYRLPLIPGGRAAIAAAMDAGAWAVTISGSGSGLFAVTAAERAAPVAAAMEDAFRAAGPGAIGFVLDADHAGVRLVDAVPSPAVAQ
ncbi:MAG: homoserine kinase [Gemmatimonadota bacterium]